MEKQSFLLYLGVGFLMTLGVWGLMGGCSSDETKVKQAAQSEDPIPKENLAVPTNQSHSLKPEEILVKTEPKINEPVSEPLESKKIQTRVIEKKEVIRKVKKVKMIEEEKVLIHVVEKGDTLWGISRKYKTTVEDIMNRNDMSGMNVRIGQKLQIKGTVEVPQEYYVEEKVEVPVEIVKTEAVPAPQKAEPVIEKKKEPEVQQVKAPLPVPETAPAVVKTEPSAEMAKSEIEKEEKPEPIGPTMESFTGELLTHEVDSEDTIEGIADQYKTTVTFLKDINGLTEKSQLHEGQILLVPGK